MVDVVVGFEATRAFASFEDPELRSRSNRLARLNSEFMNLCTRLRALHTFTGRLNAADSDTASFLKPQCLALAGLIAVRGDVSCLDETYVNRRVQKIMKFRSDFLSEADCARKSIEGHVSDSELLNFDTTAELLYEFASEYIRYAQTYVS